MNNPVWIDERGKIIEPEYCRDFLSRHPIRCINDRFYTVEGPLPDESKLKRTIYEEISPWLHAKVAQTVEQIIKALKLAAYVNNILDFLDSEGYVAFKADYESSTKNLYAAYKRWCEDNAENPLSPKSFANQLSQNTKRYHLEPVNNLHIGGGKRCRGYMGIYVLLSPMEL